MTQCGDDTSICLKPAYELARHIREKEFSALELLDTFLKRIKVQNPGLNAVIAMDEGAARRRAREADDALATGRLLGPMHGLPITVKEMFDVDGFPTTWGNPDFVNNFPSKNALSVQRLINAGAIVIGKTNVPADMVDWETSNPLFGATRNPWNRDRTPGGSSGGSAVAVATGMTAVDLAHEWGGSIRYPCHCNGVYGITTTTGIVPNQGTSRAGAFRDFDFCAAGPIARSARDLGLVLSVVAGPNVYESEGWSLRLPPSRHNNLAGFRVAVMSDTQVCPVDGSYVEVIESVVSALERDGVKISRVARPEIDMDRVLGTFTSLVRAGTSAHVPEPQFAAMQKVAAEGRANGEQALRNAVATTATYRTWILSHEVRLHMMRAWHAFFADYDIFLCPAAASAAPPFDDSGLVAERTIQVNGSPLLMESQHFWYAHSSLGQLPSVVAPIGFVTGGLPVGLQILGPRFGDYTAIRFADLLADVTGGFVPPRFSANCQ